MARRMLGATHEWFIGAALRATLNQPKSAGLPRAEIDPTKGVGAWHNLPDIDDDAPAKAVGVIGERPAPRTTRGKTLPYNLIVKASHGGAQAELDDYMDALRGAFSDRNALGLLVVTPWAGLGDEIWATYARVLEFDADELQTRPPSAAPSPWQRDPILSLRQLDGRWLWWNESGTPGDPMVFTEGDDAVVVTNNGSAPTEPVITVAGVALHDAIHIGRDATDEDITRSLWFLDLPAGTLTVDFAKRQAKVGATDVTDNLDVPNSDWWRSGVPAIPPGSVNVWRGPGAGGALTCSFFSASW